MNGNLKLNKHLLKLIKIFFLIVFSISFKVFSQETPDNWQLNYGYGSVIKHKESMGHLVTRHPRLFQWSWSHPADTLSVWKKRFNYPDVGISIFQEQFRNDILGTVTGINYVTTHYLRNRNARHQFLLDIGVGFAYSNKPFDLQSNNKNNSISSSITFSQHLKLNYKTPLINHFSFQMGGTFVHFSNAGYKNPNNGINTVFMNLGLNYVPFENITVYPNKTKPNNLCQSTRWQTGVSFKMGLHESYPNIGTKPIYEISTFLSKKIKPLAHLLMGFDFINSKSDKRYAELIYVSRVENLDRTLSDHKRIGIYAGYEQFFDKISIEGDVGYYLYAPFDIHPDLYQKIEIKYHFPNSNFSTGLGLRLHFFRANYASAQLHYTLF